MKKQLIILFLINLIISCLGIYIPTEETIEYVEEFLVKTQVVGNESVFVPVGFAWTSNVNVENAIAFTEIDWLNINNLKTFTNHKGRMELDITDRANFNTKWVVQVAEKINLIELNEESGNELGNVDDRDYDEDDPATDPVAIIFEALNSHPASKKFIKDFFMYSLFLPPTASIQKIIDQSEGEAISPDSYRKYTEERSYDKAQVSVVKNLIEIGDEGFPYCKTIHFFYTFQSERDKKHYSDLLLIKDSDDKTTQSYNNKEEQKLEVVRYSKHTYYTKRDAEPTQQDPPPVTKEVDVPSYQDKVIQCFVDNDRLFHGSTPYEVKMRAIIILERIFFPLFDILCEDDWREECWDITTSRLTETSIINMSEKSFFMDCIADIVKSDEEMQDTFYATGKFKNIFELQKYKFSAPIAPLTRNSDIIVESKESDNHFVEANPLTLGQYYDLYLKRNNNRWCQGRQNTLLCFGRVDPEKVKNSNKKDINDIINNIRYGILRYEKTKYIKKSQRK